MHAYLLRRKRIKTLTNPFNKLTPGKTEPLGDMPSKVAGPSKKGSSFLETKNGKYKHLSCSKIESRTGINQFSSKNSENYLTKSLLT